MAPNASAAAEADPAATSTPWPACSTSASPVNRRFPATHSNRSPSATWSPTATALGRPRHRAHRARPTVIATGLAKLPRPLPTAPSKWLRRTPSHHRTHDSPDRPDRARPPNSPTRSAIRHAAHRRRNRHRHHPDRHHSGEAGRWRRPRSPDRRLGGRPVLVAAAFIHRDGASVRESPDTPTPSSKTPRRATTKAPNTVLPGCIRSVFGRATHLDASRIRVDTVDGQARPQLRCAAPAGAWPRGEVERGTPRTRRRWCSIRSVTAGSR